MNKAWNFFILMIIVNVAAIACIFFFNLMYPVPRNTAAMTLIFVNLGTALVYFIVSYRNP